MYHWPSEHAEGVLGPHFEVLDPIRMDLSCYISHDATKNIFTVAGDFNDNVREALIRLRKTYFLVVARGYSPSKSFHFNPDHTQTTENAMVDLVRCTPMRTGPHTALSAVQPRVQPHLQFVGETSFVDYEAKTSVVKNLERLVARALFVARIHRGCLRMRVRLGRLVLDTYKKNTRQMSHEAFEGMMQDSRMQGVVTQE